MKARVIAQLTPEGTRVSTYIQAGHVIDAILDENAARALRDDLNVCLTEMRTREMAARWEGSE